MNKFNFLKDKIKKNENVIGTWITIPSLTCLDVICSTNIDFVVIDREHGPIGFEKAQEMIICAESNDVSPVVRPHSLTESEILRSLDIGSHGVQVPNISSIDDVKLLEHYSKYPPLGNRGFSPFTRSSSYSLDNAENIATKSNKNIVTIVNLEGIEAFENIDSILENDLVDVYFIGLFDLSKSLGIAGKIHHKNTQDMFEKMITKIRNKKKYVGTISTTEKDLISYKNLGVNYLVHLVDVEMIRSAYKNIVNLVK